MELIDIHKRYRMGDQVIHALDNVSLIVRQNEFLAITGSSGSGKSTLLNIVGCLDTPTSGTYRIAGEEPASMGEAELARVRNTKIGFVFQSFNLLPRATALENVEKPLTYRAIPRKERLERARDCLGRVGLGNRSGHLPNQLSGGQRQRVAIARAICGRPSILLADEPTGNLDSATTAEIMALFRELHREGQTLILITHEAEIADQCERVVRMADGVVISDAYTGKCGALVG